MNPKVCLPVTAIVWLAFAWPSAAQDPDPEHDPVADLGKAMIELPLKEQLAVERVAPTQKINSIDVSKMRIEAPVENVVERAATASETGDNPRVEPGLVNWHADFEVARAASRESGKPVFLFHLLGRLDQEFT